MITVFNRRSVYFGYSLRAFNRAREILQENNISYSYQVRTSDSSAFLPVGQTGPGEPPANPIYVNSFQLFVHKKDFTSAIYLLQTAGDE